MNNKLISTTFRETEFNPTNDILLWGVITIYIWMYFIEVKGEKRVASNFQFKTKEN